MTMSTTSVHSAEFNGTSPIGREPVNEFMTATKESMDFWPPVSTQSADLAGASFTLVMFRWCQNLATVGALMRKMNTVVLNPESEVLRKISTLFPQEPVTEKNFISLMRHFGERLSSVSSFTVGRIYTETFTQSVKDLFEPTAHQYLCKFCDHPVASVLLRQVDRELFLQLPGKKEDALRIATKVQKRIALNERLKNDPDIQSLLKDFEQELEKVLREQGKTLFTQPGIIQ